MPLSYRIPSKVNRELRGTARADHVVDLLREGPLGVLAYDRDEPVGWAAVAPRAARSFARNGKIPRVHDLPVWSLARSRRRRQRSPATGGVMRREVSNRSNPTNLFQLTGDLAPTLARVTVTGRAASNREPRWLDAAQQHAWRAFVLGTTLLTDRIDDDLRRLHGISAVEYEILVRLSEAGGQLRMARLAAALAHSRSRVTHTVKRMETAGLVQRTDSTEDGRGVVAQLTKAGARLLWTAAPDHVETVRNYLVDLVDPADLAALGRVMDAVSDKLIAEHPERELRG